LNQKSGKKLIAMGLEKMSSDGGKRGKRRKSGKEESRGEGRD
jgi:hypothetical protein